MEHILRRMVQMIPTLLGLTLAVFLVMRVIPGDAAVAMLEESPTAAQKDAIRAELGLDKPIHEQYLKWMAGLMRGDMGTSFWTNQPVLTEIKRAAPVTIELGLLAAFTAALVGIPVGILSAVKQNTAFDYVGRSVSIMALSIPNFWLGTLAIVLPAIWFGWVPPTTYRPIWEAPLHNLGQFWMPTLVTGLSASGALTRMTRSAMLEVLREDYVRTAQAKGLAPGVIIRRHALKNAMIPVVTMFGTLLAGMLTGAVITETLFNLPGFGRLTIDAISQRDYPLIQGAVLLFGVTYVVINLVIDLSYVMLNPRIRLGRS